MLNDQVRTRRSFPKMRTRFKRNIKSRLFQNAFIGQLLNRVDFRMRFSCFLMPRFSNYLIAQSNYTTDHRIWISLPQSIFGQLNTTLHHRSEERRVGKERKCEVWGNEYNTNNQRRRRSEKESNSK